MPGTFTIVRQSNSSLELISKQTEAQEWIQSVLNTQFPNADFGKSLEDGVLLCRLAIAIKPGCIKKINNTKLKFKMFENVNYFVEFSRQYGLKEQILFHPNDLCERKNMMKVVNLIHTLADFAGRNGFQPKMEKLIPDDWTFNNTVKNTTSRMSASFDKPTKKKEDPSVKEKKVSILDPDDTDGDMLLERLRSASELRRDEDELSSQLQQQNTNETPEKSKEEEELAKKKEAEEMLKKKEEEEELQKKEEGRREKRKTEKRR